jgi:hypothetical protein
VLKPGQMYADAMSLSEAVRLIDSGVRLERIGRGEGDPYYGLWTHRCAPTAYTALIQPSVQINAVFQTTIGAFMRDNPTRVGAKVELLEAIAKLTDGTGAGRSGGPVDDRRCWGLTRADGEPLRLARVGPFGGLPE